jgi:O-antigen/teichoic acid export membrane protein
MPKEKHLAEKIIRNTFFNLTGKVWAGLVSFVLTPYIIHRIGIEKFGIWALVGVITGYFGMLDFGIGGSFIKYIAEFYTKKDYEKINQVVNTGIFFYFLFTLFIVTSFIFICKPLFILLKIPLHLYSEALFVFLLGVIIFGLYNILNAFSTVIDGLQRMDISNKVAIFISIPNIVGTVFFLEKGYGLPGLMVNNLIILVINSLVNIFISFKVLPELKFSLCLFSREMLKRLFCFGYKAQVTALAMLINNSIVKLLTSHFLNLSMVGYYELGQKIIMLVRDTLLWPLYSLAPAAAEVEAKKDTQGIHELYFRVSKYVHGVAIPLMALVFVTAPLIILAWTGSAYKISVLVILILAPAYMINMFTAVGTFVAYGIGRPGITARAWVATVIFNLVISTVLIIKTGFVGVVTGMAFSLIIGSIIFIGLFNKYLKTSFSLFFKMTVLKPLLASIISGIAVYLLLKYYSQAGGLSYGRIINLSFLSLSGIIFMCLYAIFILKINYLDIYDRSNIVKILNFLRLRGSVWKR